MKSKITIAIILGIVLISLVSAIEIQAGTSDVFRINTTDKIYYTVVGNSSNLEGMIIEQDIYDDYSNITISFDLLYKEDNFTIIFFNKEKETIHHYPSGGGGGGGSSTKYVYRNITTYIDREVYNESEGGKEIILENDTIEYIGYIISGLLFLIIVIILIKKKKMKCEGLNGNR